MDHPAGESDDGALRVDFDRRLRLDFHGSRITSDAGLLAYRELDDALGLTDLASGALSEARRGRNTRHLLAGLLRQSVFGRLAGYEDVNGADRLAHDPAMRAVVDRGGLDRRAASTSQMGRFETGWLTSEANLAALADLSGAWIDRVHARRPQSVIVLDMDSSVSETHGGQEGSAYNGHFGGTCYHPLFVFNPFGDLERCALRPGNVHSADGWRALLAPVMARYRGRMKRRCFRADAAFASPEIYELLEAEGDKYTIRLPANAVLQESIAWLLQRPVGRPPHEVRRYHASFGYRAGSWSKARRVVAKVEWHPGELYPRVGFIVTNMTRPAERVVAFYNQRGTAEQHIKEGKNAELGSNHTSPFRIDPAAVALSQYGRLRDFRLSETPRRAELAGEADTLRARMTQIGADIGHLDAVIRQFDPDYNLAGIRPKRVRAGDGAGRGEMSRAVLAVLRGATEPMTTAAVVAAVMAGRGMDGQDRKAVGLMMGRVGMALQRQERNGAVKGVRGAGQAVVWEIAR